MSLKFLLDTNVLSEPLKPAPDPGVLEQLDRHAHEVATSSIVWHELQFGIASLAPGRRRAAGERYLQHVIGANMPMLAYDASAALWHAHERARLAARGRTAPFVDGQIAAIAAVHGLTLVTANTRDFRHFTELRIVRWHR